MFAFIFLFNLIILAESYNDSASLQLYRFKQKTKGPVGIITTSAGAPVDRSDTYCLLNRKIINNEFFMTYMTSLVRERIPSRHVHSKGFGAFGYFKVTRNISDICKAKVFSENGKKSVAARFSNTIGVKGGPDTVRNIRGFATKFYTEEGNFDLLGLNFPVFSIKDPVFFLNMNHALSVNPETFLEDYNMFWDFFLGIPQTYHLLLYFFSHNGLPYTYRHMRMFSIHTYQFVNDKGENWFGKFYIIPDAGAKYLTQEQAKNITIEDSNYYGRDLYNKIEDGYPPSWTVKLQIFSLEDIKKHGDKIFDITRTICKKKYKLRTVGKLVLNRNQKNYFADIEQLAFCVGNLVPGVCGAPDKDFEARRLFYREAQTHRLHANFHKIRVNRPRTKVDDYTRNGAPPIGRNSGGEPGYYPNSFHGAVPRREKYKCKLIKIHEKPANNTDQVKAFYEDSSEAERTRLVQAIVETLSRTVDFLQQKAVRIFTDINSDFGDRVAKELEQKRKM